MNQLGIAHGGVTMTLIDVALGTAARSGADKSAVITHPFTFIHCSH